MAYNQDKSIIIVDTQDWTVKKTLTDEKVTLFSANLLALYSTRCYSLFTVEIKIQCLLLLEMWQIYRRGR